MKIPSSNSLLRSRSGGKCESSESGPVFSVGRALLAPNFFLIDRFSCSFNRASFTSPCLTWNTAGVMISEGVLHSGQVLRIWKEGIFRLVSRFPARISNEASRRLRYSLLNRFPSAIRGHIPSRIHEGSSKVYRISLSLCQIFRKLCRDIHRTSSPQMPSEAPRVGLAANIPICHSRGAIRPNFLEHALIGYIPQLLREACTHSRASD